MLAGISLSQGVIIIDGSAGADRGQVSIAQNGQVTVTLTSFSREYFDVGSVNSIYFRGFEGNDTFVNETGFNSVAVGGPGNEIFVGGSGSDNFSGGPGNDSMVGNNGNDVINGGSGADVIYGGNDDDRLIGNDGDDTISGNAGNDFIDGEAGSDELLGSGGDDNVRGGDGNDDIFGGTGNDILVGGLGADRMFGHNGNDRLEGQAGNDRMIGGNGNDTMRGGNNADYMDGGAGDDQFYGGDGNDTLLGQTGADVLRGEAGNDVLNGGNQDDYLDGGAGNDVLRGGWGHDILSGGSGADELFGEGANDTLRGGTGNDLLKGGKGNDSLDSGSGTDVYSLSGTVNRFNITIHAGGSMTMIDNQSNSEGRDTVSNTERIRFTDGERVRSRLLARNLNEAEKASRTLLNQLRASVGSGPVNAINDLSVFAESWSRTMAQSGFRHSPREMQEPYVTDGRTRFGENIAFTSDTSLSAQQAASYFHNIWRNSANHYPNMINADYTEIGIGMVRLSNGWWATHNFSDLH